MGKHLDPCESAMHDFLRGRDRPRTIGEAIIYEGRACCFRAGWKAHEEHEDREDVRAAREALSESIERIPFDAKLRGGLGL